MGRSFEETKRMVIEIITNIDPGITEKDIEQMLEDEMKNPADQMNLPWIDLLPNALDPLPLSERGQKDLVENVSKMHDLNKE